MLSFCYCALLLARLTSSAPAASGSGSEAASSTAVTTATASSAAVTTSSTTSLQTLPSSFPPETATVAPVSSDPNEVITGDEPIRGHLGASIQGPVNEEIDLQNPDLLAPPSTDHGSFDNAKWPFSLSHNRLQTGGWARQQNSIGDMPLATEMAGVNMRLLPGAVRELHWHKTAEWAYVLKGTTQVSSVDQEGRNYLASVKAGDLWYFPPGIPHSLQATGDDPDGSEFLLIFDDGDFSEDSTFLLTDWLAHTPMEVIQRNFQALGKDDFFSLPSQELYIFPAGYVPKDTDTAPESPQGTVPLPFSFALSEMEPTKLNGGSVKIVDSTVFNISKTIAVAEVTVQPGAIREMHWHPTQDEWTFFLEGEARVTIFAAQSNARTFNYQAGDIAYVPTAMGHYVENIGNTTLKYLGEIFKTDKFADVSLSQWLALTPPELVKAHLGINDDTVGRFSKTKQVVVAE
ncbi:oxalate decarboxylase [Schizophyllum commune]